MDTNIRDPRFATSSMREYAARAYAEAGVAAPESANENQPLTIEFPEAEEIVPSGCPIHKQVQKSASSSISTETGKNVPTTPPVLPTLRTQ